MGGRSTSDRKLAQAIEGKIRTQLVEGKYFDLPEGKNKTFGNLSERYLLECTVKKSERSQDRDKSILKKHLNPFFGDMFLSDISPKHISHYKQKREKIKVSPDTVIKELGLMKAAFNVAIREWEWLDSNPVSKVRMEKAGRGRVKFLSNEEFEALYSTCDGWLKPLVLVARYTGLRQGNLLSLQWNQIDLFRKTITIEQTKNGERLGLPICDRLFKMLVGLKKVQDIRSKLIFSSPYGKKICRQKIRRAFKSACNKVGCRFPLA